jgi:hypothetical protein
MIWIKMSASFPSLTADGSSSVLLAVPQMISISQNKFFSPPTVHFWCCVICLRLFANEVTSLTSQRMAGLQTRVVCPVEVRLNWVCADWLLPCYGVSLACLRWGPNAAQGVSQISSFCSQSSWRCSSFLGGHAWNKTHGLSHFCPFT